MTTPGQKLWMLVVYVSGLPVAVHPDDRGAAIELAAEHGSRCCDSLGVDFNGPLRLRESPIGGHE